MKRISILLAAMMLAANAYARLSTPYTGDDAWCVGSDGAEVCVDSSGNLLPTTSNDTTLGSSSYLWATIYAYDLTLSDDLVVSGDAGVTGDLTVTDDATVNGKLLVDNDTAADTAIRILGATSQVGALLLAETAAGTNILVVTPTGVLVRTLTMAQVDVTTPGNAGEIIIVTDRTSTLYGICIATGTAVAQYKLASGTDVQTSGCGTGL